jgi:hypothetical protein
MTTRKLAWTACVGTVIFLCALCFTPLVIPAGQSQPRFLGLPRTLWLGLLIYAGLVLLTFIATRVYTGTRDDEGDPQ